MPDNVPTFRFHQLSVTVSANTPSSAPLVTDWTLGPANLDLLELQVPPGPAGTMGVAVHLNAESLVPWGPVGQWLVVDDYTRDFDIDQWVQHTLKVMAYNEDVNDHVFWWRAKLNPFAVPGLGPLQGRALVL